MPSGLWMLLNGIISAAIVMTTFLLGNRNSKQEKEEQRKEQFVNTSYEFRLKAYSRLFVSLKKFEEYYFLFLSPGNEFKASADIKDFAPIENITEFKKAYEMEGLWLTKNTTKSINHLLDESYIGGSLALTLHSQSLEDMEDSLHKAVEEHCKHILDEISKVQEVLRADVGVKYMNDYIKNWDETSDEEKYESAFSQASATREEEK